MGVTVLVVDDNSLALRLSRMVLEREGHRVVALAHWSDVSDTLFREDIDIAFVDVNMPGLQGDQLVSILKQTRKGRATPVILVSNLPSETLRQKAQSSGADDWIQKPLTSEAVRQKIEKLVRTTSAKTGDSQT